MATKARSWFAVIVAFALVAGLAAGCTTPTTGGDTTGGGTTPAVKTIKAGVLTIGSDTAFPPFETMKGDVAEGFDVDLANAVAKKMGLTVDFKSYKFDALIPALKAGSEFDAIMSAMTITDDRKKEIDFSDPYIASNQSLVVKDTSTTKTTKDLKGKKIGVQSGTTGEAWTKANVKDARQIVPFDDVLSAFGALQAGNVDAVINDLPVSAFIVKDPARKLKLVEEIKTGENYGIAVSKANPDLLAAINKSLDEVKASGEYDTIYKKWFGVAPGSL